MRIVIALGGNALLRRGDPLTMQVQRRNVNPRRPAARGEAVPRQPGNPRCRGRARGRIESWRKWSFPIGLLGPDEAGPPGWTVVHKRRRMSRFQLVSGRLTADVLEQATESACTVDLTEVRSGGETWWSLGFEATGPAALLRSTLQGTIALMFAKAPPGDVEFDMRHSQSYADWLSRHRVTAAIHRQEGQESPARRRQDQTRHLISRSPGPEAQVSQFSPVVDMTQLPQ